MVLIITGTIAPSSQVGQLELKNVEERWKQYYDSIFFYISQGCFKKIIFCENSNYGLKGLKPLLELAEEKHIQLELSSFQGDTERVVAQGKGYGEAEIMSYIFANSNLIKDETMFAKVTGRLIVTNVMQILSKIKEGNCYFNVPNHTTRHMYDTRFYMMPIELFKQYFLDAKEQIMDDEGIFLETVYTNRILQKDINTKNFPLYPRIIGQSGSSGESYSFIEWKSKIKDMLSKLNFYGRIKPSKG